MNTSPTFNQERSGLVVINPMMTLGHGIDYNTLWTLQHLTDSSQSYQVYGLCNHPEPGLLLHKCSFHNNLLEKPQSSPSQTALIEHKVTCVHLWGMMSTCTVLFHYTELYCSIV